MCTVTMVGVSSVYCRPGPILVPVKAPSACEAGFNGGVLLVARNRETHVKCTASTQYSFRPRQDLSVLRLLART
jgi:hypothetical protein